uniref:Protein phosphatase 1, regulatory subunit 12C n=1 Tax=Nothobranchius korthausae TaxID=1143690 RepID=A0A1A8FZW2_9TELE
MTRSASSPRLSSEADTKEPRLARVPPIPTRRPFGAPDNTPDNANSWLSRSSSYTRRLHSQLGNEFTSSTPSLLHSSSYRRRLDDNGVTSASTATGLGRPNTISGQRLPQEQTEAKDVLSINTSNSGDQETKQRRKSYLTPVRDEEAEAQRKARSRHARQSRRSTQGVTLTDLQEAEKTIKTMTTDNKGREKKEEEEKEVKQKKGEEGEVSWRSRIANLQKSDLLGLTQPAGSARSQSDRREAEASTGESETERWTRERRERRQARANRKVQRTGESEDNPSEEEFSGGGLDPQKDQHTRSSLDSSCNDRSQATGADAKDFKKLFEEVSRENTQLQAQLQDTQRIDRRMLERRMAELEEELKVLVDLKADNQRLKDENGALIRVISKLSK